MWVLSSHVEILCCSFALKLEPQPKVDYGPSTAVLVGIIQGAVCLHSRGNSSSSHSAATTSPPPPPPPLSPAAAITVSSTGATDCT